MSELKFCQGPECHMHKTKDRIKELKAVRLIKLEEEVVFIMAMIIFVL